MDSPTFHSTWSKAFILSDDSGLILTNGSFSNGSLSVDEKAGSQISKEDIFCFNMSYSQNDSFDEISEFGNEQYNSIKKEDLNKYVEKSFSIDPPPEFQDVPIAVGIDDYARKLSAQIISLVFRDFEEVTVKRVRSFHCLLMPSLHSSNYYWGTPDFALYSPCHGIRPNSRCSLVSSRLSSSHNSLSAPTSQKQDDSNFITQAVSHDVLSSQQLNDMYNVPLDEDVYAVPIDDVRFTKKPKNIGGKGKKQTTVMEYKKPQNKLEKKLVHKTNEGFYYLHKKSKRHSVAGISSPTENEPIHMTLEEVRHYLKNLQPTSEVLEQTRIYKSDPSEQILTNNNNYKHLLSKNHSIVQINTYKDINPNHCKLKRNTFFLNAKNKKQSCDNLDTLGTNQDLKYKKKKLPSRFFSVKQTLCNIFKLKKCAAVGNENNIKNSVNKDENIGADLNSIVKRALPPLPRSHPVKNIKEPALDFATSIEKVKDYGWYWGPLSSEAAEKVLSNEPDGSFIVRDSSDDHYIFSLTFKLNDYVRHVRIEHDQGNFSFGNCTKFKSQTIIDFIENAVEHSQSGRYLFFLHRRPLIGPVRVQLLHPVSRFKQVQSLQHMCRFVIHKAVRRDLIPELPLPRRMIDYLNTPNYYSEHFVDLDESNSQSYDDNSKHSSLENHQENISNDEQQNTRNDYIVLDGVTNF